MWLIDATVLGPLCPSRRSGEALITFFFTTIMVDLKKRKATSRSLPSKKKIKIRHSNTSTLPWKTTSRPLEAGIDADDGILELEEVEGVEVFYEEGKGGKIARFNVRESDTQSISSCGVNCVYGNRS